MKHAWTIALALGLVAPEVHAFPEVQTFQRTANTGGGSRMYATGSPRFRGYDCTVCHIDPPGKIAVEIVSEPDLFASEGYVPFERYTLTVKMLGEHLGQGIETDANVFVAEVVDDSGTSVGLFEDIQPQQPHIYDDASADGVVMGVPTLTSWTFEYEAPAPGSGRLSLHLAAVDGNGGLTQPAPRAPTATDPLGDDVFVGVWRICESGVPCDTSADEPPSAPDSPAAHGCAMAPPSSGPSWWSHICLVALVAYRHQHRRRNP